MKPCLAITLAVFLLSAFVSSAAPVDRPNIVFVLVDVMG